VAMRPAGRCVIASWAHGAGCAGSLATEFRSISTEPLRPGPRDSHGTNACNAESPIHLYGSRNTFLDAPVPSRGARSSDRDDAIGGTSCAGIFRLSLPRC
jgi:hypothetical protein